MASVVLSGYLFLIMLTISAFYFGDTLHASTTSALSVIWRNSDLQESRWSSRVREAPATTIAVFFFLFGLFEMTSAVSCFMSFFFISNKMVESSSISLSMWFDSRMMYWSIFSLLSRRPADIPILIAVPILSPVRTHTLMPASFANWIVLSTSSCNLSSIAVEPMSSRSFSI